MQTDASLPRNIPPFFHFREKIVFLGKQNPEIVSFSGSRGEGRILGVKVGKCKQEWKNSEKNPKNMRNRISRTRVHPKWIPSKISYLQQDAQRLPSSWQRLEYKWGCWQKKRGGKRGVLHQYSWHIPTTLVEGSREGEEEKYVPKVTLANSRPPSHLCNQKCATNNNFPNVKRDSQL